MSDFKDRLIVEHKDLNEKIMKLYDFIYHNDAYMNLPIDQRDLLQLQLNTMRSYYKILDMRLKLI